ncbi:hypothetical protein BLA13014_06502 [Burkholderia aenigmatica]|uniref:Uncharacterized protein n=1 Tax=Burkholderia aenigmatica TaxID=2015348 RepID=A0A6P2RP22_9BURK|nr:hypothetical protein BLA13014_06502 [Burkholderia aenigmatica]
MRFTSTSSITGTPPCVPMASAVRMSGEMHVMTGAASSFFQVRMTRGGYPAAMRTGSLGCPMWLERDSLRSRSTHNNPLPDTHIAR